MKDKIIKILNEIEPTDCHISTIVPDFQDTNPFAGNKIGAEIISQLLSNRDNDAMWLQASAKAGFDNGFAVGYEVATRLMKEESNNDKGSSSPS